MTTAPKLKGQPLKAPSLKAPSLKAPRAAHFCLLSSIVIMAMLFSHFARAETYSFAFVPQQSAKKLAKKWVPILNYLGEKTGDTYQFRTAKNIPTFEQRVLNKNYDIAYMNPYHFVVFNEKADYRALAKQRNKQIKGIIVVRKDATLESLQQLANQKLAFPAPAAFAASILPRAELGKRNIAFTPKYVSSHDSVYLNVAKGFMPAGGGVMRTFNNTNAETREQLRVLWTTPGYTPHAFAVKDSFPADAAERLLQAMLSMNDTEQGKTLLKSVSFKGMEAANNSDWNDVKELALNTLLGTN